MNDDLINGQNALIALNSGLAGLAVAHPVFGAIFGGVAAIASIGMNADSSRKLNRRLALIEHSIRIVDEKLKSGQCNFESILLAPEVFKEYLITDDEERAKEYMELLVGIFSSGRIEFDALQEALRMITALSSNEYKILKLVPDTFMKWDEAFVDKGYIANEEDWSAALQQLRSKHLVDILLPLYPGSVNNQIRFTDKETVCLTNYGKRILDTIRMNSSELNSASEQPLQPDSAACHGSC